MERNPWKLATIGLTLVGTTALGTGLTTAYVLRRPTEAPTVAADCATGKDRAMKIAKPGVIGGLLGAGLGAAGGAVADGGDGAGKGALIGGLAGTVLGGGYGAYHTKSECGTIFGNTFSAPATSAAAPVPFDGKGITVYNAR